ncbi:hypothetical protein NEAUS03_0298 [Nematocida ausubeli]|nr:hypothetical protein NEAUS03_0298 [Nematocida ausubeli]
MKIYSSVIWIKAVALISVLLMNICRADLSISEVETTLKFKIATDSSQVVINPEGPLNFLRGYIYQKMDCMYNKRFFSPQIDTEYSVEEHTTESSIHSVYKYNRAKQNDKAYEALPENKMDVYCEKYHNHLIELFPSPTGDITIETRGNQSFIQFLRAETTKEHSLNILAMLLLFSEGVDVPIKVNNTVLKVYEKDKKDEIYFTVPMIIPWLNTKEGKVENLKQKKVKQLISFFQDNATNREVFSMMEDMCSYDGFATGKFLDSPKFLIQSYIFGFIGTAERAIEFIQAVHTMTEKYAPKTEAPSKDDSVYDRLFKPASNSTDTNFIALMKKTQEILNEYRVFPFADSTQVPAYKSLPRYNRKTKLFSTNYLEDYSNCVECMILSLFCCLAYDLSDFKYKTNHMGSVSKELEEFFSPENQPFDTTKSEFQREWCRVVADLDEPSIAYCTGRNELDTGLINMLMVIAEIVKAPEDEKKKILGFSQSLKDKHGELDSKLRSDIETYTEALLKRLSKTETMQVKFSDLKSNLYINGRYDLSGDITIIFEHNFIQNTMVLCISEGHSTINMKPTIMKNKDDRIKKMTEISSISNNGSTFVENLFSTYIEYEIRKISSPVKSIEFIRQQVHKTEENKFEDINRLLLVKKISDFNYKVELVTCSIIQAMNQKISPRHPIVRFTSNILGSTELDNWYAQVHMLPSIALAGLHTKNGSNLNYPNIKLSEKRYIYTVSLISPNFFIDYVLDCNMDVFIRWIRFYIDNFYSEHGLGLNPLLDPTLNRIICQHIFKNGIMHYSNIIDNMIIQKRNGNEDKILSILHLLWAVYLCVEEPPNIELIKANLDAIREIEVISWNCANYIENPSIFWQAIKKFNVLKGQLCKKRADVNTLKSIIKALKNR